MNFVFVFLEIAYILSHGFLNLLYTVIRLDIRACMHTDTGISYIPTGLYVFAF